MSGLSRSNVNSVPIFSSSEKASACGDVPRSRKRTNLVGSMIAKLRYHHGWRQDDLVARLQIVGCDMTRDVLANIETRRSPVTDTQIDFFCRVFNVPVQDLFPPPCPPSQRIRQAVVTGLVTRRPCRTKDDSSDE